MAEVTAELECTRMVMRNLDSNYYDDEVDKNSDDIFLLSYILL